MNNTILLELNIEAELNQLSEKQLDKLLLAEKDRRNIPHDQLLFIGMADIADYCWCPTRSVITTLDMETSMFWSYLFDRITYSVSLGYIDRLPKNKEQWLTIGDNITKNDVEKLLKDAPLRNDDEVIEHYPTIRWNYPIGNYIIIGVPDGLTNNFAYECKKTASSYLLNFVKAGAFAQANFYGHFFQRSEARVQIHIREENKTETWQVPTNHDEAIHSINIFDSYHKDFLHGIYEKLPSPSWKCRKNGSCDYRDDCPLVEELE